MLGGIDIWNGYAEQLVNEGKQETSSASSLNSSERMVRGYFDETPSRSECDDVAVLVLLKVCTINKSLALLFG